MGRTHDTEAICRIIRNSMDWQSGVEFTACKVKSKANAQAHTTITLKHGYNALVALVDRGEAVQIGNGKFRKKICQNYRATWRKRTNEEIGIHSRLVAGMGWIPVYSRSV